MQQGRRIRISGVADQRRQEGDREVTNNQLDRRREQIASPMCEAPESALPMEVSRRSATQRPEGEPLSARERDKAED